MSTVALQNRAVSLAASLRELRRRAWSIGAAAAGGWGAVALIVSLAAFAWVDLAVDLNGPMRLACAMAAIAVAVVVLVRVLIRFGNTSSLHAMARRLDTVCNARGQVLSGVDLAAAGPIAAPLTSGLAHLAIQRATEIVRTARPDVVVPGSDSRLSLSALTLSLVILGVVAVISPRMVGAEWSRFADPFGDHPPYSTLTFDVKPGDTKVLYGGNVDVSVTVNGGTPDRVELVLGSAAPEPLPMFPEGNGQWRATVSGVTEATTYIVRSGRARTRQFDLALITVPQLSDVKFRVELPAYTHRSAYQGPLPRNGIEGLPNTAVEVHAFSNRPLGSGSIVFTPESSSTTQPTAAPTAIAMHPSADGASDVIGSFLIRQTGRITIGVTDVSGQASEQTLTTSVTLLTDQRPFVRIVEPKPDSFATPDAIVNSQIIAEDDYGISALTLYRGLNDSRPTTQEIHVPAAQPTQFPATVSLHLGDYGLKPGDAIQMFARTLDNDPAGPKGAESSAVTLHIISQQDMDKLTMAQAGLETLMSKYAAAERRIEAIDNQIDQLQKQLSRQDPNSPVADATRQKIADLSKQLDQAADEIDKSALHELPIDLDANLTKTLTDLANAARAAATQADALSQKPGLGAAGASDQLQQIRQQLGVAQQELKDDANAPLQYLAQIFPLIEDQARFVDLYNRQKDLAQRMDSLRDQNGKDDPALKARMRDLEDEQGRAGADLRQLLDDIDNHVAALPPDPQLDPLRDTAKKFSTDVRASNVAWQMQLAQSALADFQGTTAATSSQAAADTLNQFIARCDSIGQQSGVCLNFQPKLSSALGNSVNQLLNSMGLGTGAAGSGGGYSAMQSTLRNVGLYGATPIAGADTGASGGQADRGMPSNASGSLDDAASPGRGNGASQQQSTGQGEAPVPAEYQKRVGDYFQRVADELSH